MVLRKGTGKKNKNADISPNRKIAEFVKPERILRDNAVKDAGVFGMQVQSGELRGVRAHDEFLRREGGAE